MVMEREQKEGDGEDRKKIASEHHVARETNPPQHRGVAQRGRSATSTPDAATTEEEEEEIGVENGRITSPPPPQPPATALKNKRRHVGYSNQHNRSNSGSENILSETLGVGYSPTPFYYNLVEALAGKRKRP